MRGKRKAEELEGLLAQAQQRVTELEAELESRRIRDPITGFPTLAAFRVRLETDLQRARRYGRPLSLAIIDADGFRAINASHGFELGSRLIGALGAAIADGVRGPDLVAHAGGDEYMVLLPETTTEEATMAVGRLMQQLETLEVGPVSGVSVSAGIAGIERRTTAEVLIESANRALQRAREAGGGRAMVADIGEPEVGAETETQRDVVAALAVALLERDRYTGEHSESVVEVAARVASELGLGAEEVSRVRTAALLHDIGKVAMPDAILHKEGPLDDEEWKLMREHPVIGERILRAIPGLGGVARIVRHEHERWDGGGYPDGLPGEQIPLGARIILACDAYHAMTSDRPYRPRMAHAEAVAELSANAGSQFDPTVVEALIGVLYGRRQAGNKSL